ncbi:MAG TPA: SpoIIE family protein phosphatase [Thermoanaerobaculia bacterium]|nr:SpoIIE family protein phosphatase [Thermoanaerobaculia bacterium]
MPLLLHLSGDARGQRFQFERNVMLGRGPLADLEVNDPAVSRRHALITVSDGRCFVSDLGSGNGTFHNENRVHEPVALAEGDRIRLGSTVLELRYGGEVRREGTSASKISFREALPDVASKSVVVPMAGLRSHAGTRFAEEVARLTRRLDFFHAAGRSLSRTLDEAELLADLLAQAMEALPQADRAFVVLRNEETGEFRPVAARTRAGGTAEIPASRTLLEEVVRKREALVSIDASGDEDYQEAKSIHLLNLRAVACVPLAVEERILGVLQVDNVQQGEAFSEGDLDLLAGIAGPIALALEHARIHRQLVERELLEHDLALARKIQQSFLPQKLPSRPGWKFAAEYSPALAVGGDLYDLTVLPDGAIGFAVGDVSGKGVSAALMMARLTSALRAAAARVGRPAQVLEELNELIRSEAEEGMFVTLAYGVLDPTEGRVEMANAGHLLPVLRHADGRTGEVRLAAGTPLGIRHPLEAEAFEWKLQPGDVLVLVSDGLTEAATPKGERYDVPRFVATVKEAGSDPRAVRDALLKSARAWVAERGFDDDLTVLCLGRS